MARLAQNRAYQNFVNGIVRDVTPLETVESAAIDLLNVDRKLDGSIERRPGLVLDGNRTDPDDHPYPIDALPAVSDNFSSYDNFIESDLAIKTFVWRPTSDKGRKNVALLQAGRFLYFWEISGKVVYNNFLTTLDLSDYKADSASDPDVDRTRADFSAGYGKLYIVSEAINPLQIDYNFSTNTVSVNVISPKVRDFDIITEDVFAVDQRTSSITAAQKYDLYNKGWNDDRLNKYRSEYGVYPARNTIPSLAENAIFSNDTDIRRWDERIFEGIDFGTAEAGNGTFLFDPRKVRRTDKVSGLSSSYNFFSNTSYSTVAFFAGRVWLSGLNDERNTGRLFFSQIARNRSNLNNMYQSQDPTAKEFNELLDDDGGEIPILESGRIQQLVPMVSALVVFADNGIWQIDGGGGGFTANSYQVRQISTTPIVGLDSIIRTEKGLAFWANEAIYLLQEDELGQLRIASLTEQKIADFYNNDISFSEKVHAVASYDAFNRRVIWMYGSTQSNLDKALIMYVDNLAFFRHEYSPSDETPTVIGIFQKPFDAVQISEDILTDSSLVPITTSTFEDIVIQFQQNSQDTTDTKFFVVRESASGTPLLDVAQFEEMTGEFISSSTSLEYVWRRTFSDWRTEPYESFVEPRDENFGELQRNKQAIYISTFFERTENDYVVVSDYPDGSGGTNATVLFSEPSDAEVIGIYGYNNKYGTGKRTRAQKGYKLSRPIYPTTASVTYAELLASGGGSEQLGLIREENEYEYPEDVLERKLKIRGRGKAIRIRIGTDKMYHNFVLLGWAGQYSISANT